MSMQPYLNALNELEYAHGRTLGGEFEHNHYLEHHWVNSTLRLRSEESILIAIHSPRSMDPVKALFRREPAAWHGLACPPFELDEFEDRRELEFDYLTADFVDSVSMSEMPSDAMLQGDLV